MKNCFILLFILIFQFNGNSQSDTTSTTITIQKEFSDTLTIITESILLKIIKVDSTDSYQSIVSGFQENAPSVIRIILSQNKIENYNIKFLLKLIKHATL